MQRVICLIWVLTGLSASAHVGFIFSGDTGTGDVNQFAVAKGMGAFCATAQCDFALLLGDNFYPEGVSSVSDPQWKHKFEVPYGYLRLVFYAVLGNHDYQGSVQAEIDYSSRSNWWRMHGKYYSFQQGGAEFFALDTEKVTADELLWLDKSLAASTAEWKIVMGHHPVYSSGWHGDTRMLKKKLLPFLKKYKVDFYLSGHDHDKEVRSQDGLVFVVSGTGGEVRNVGTHAKTLFASATLGFSHLYLENHSATLRILDKDGAVQFKHSVQK